MKEEILSFNELLKLMNIFCEAGITKIRFTGGEPLTRKGIFDFLGEVGRLKQKFDLQLAITTNGILLKGNVNQLQKSGIEKLNISIDSLQNKKFLSITKQNQLESVLASVDEAVQIGFNHLKINTVLMKGINDDEILDFVDFAVNKNINVRFIEYMPFGNNGWQADYFMSWREIKSVVENKFKLIPVNNRINSVAKDYLIEEHPGTVSFISSISDHFCSSCNRLRITANGKLKLCLFTNGTNELDFKNLLNDNDLSNTAITEIIIEKLKLKQEMHPPVEDLLSYEKNNMLNIGG